MNGKALNSPIGASVNGTDEREARPKRWLGALVQVRSEKAVGEKLTRMGIENYVATQWEIHQWSDRKKKVERVVIPMVVFGHADVKTERRLRTYTYIYKLVSYPGRYDAAVIPDAQIERLKYMLHHAETTVEMMDQSFEVGDTVHIARGPLKGLQGELCYIDPDKPKVAIRIECLGYACVNISKNDIVNYDLWIIIF